jgi:hypothetical protein
LTRTLHLHAAPAKRHSHTAHVSHTRRQEATTTVHLAGITHQVRGLHRHSNHGVVHAQVIALQLLSPSRHVHHQPRTLQVLSMRHTRQGHTASLHTRARQRRASRQGCAHQQGELRAPRPLHTHTHTHLTQLRCSLVVPYGHSTVLATHDLLHTRVYAARRVARRHIRA